MVKPYHLFVLTTTWLFIDILYRENNIIFMKLSMPQHQKIKKYFFFSVQSPASVEKIVLKTSNFSVELSWKVTGPRISSYLTHFIIYLNDTRMQRIRREQYGTRYILRELKPFTDYVVGIQAQDSSLQRSGITYERFKTKQAGKRKEI